MSYANNHSLLFTFERAFTTSRMHNLIFHFTNVYPQQCSRGIRMISQKVIRFWKHMFINVGLCALAWRPTFQQFDIDRKGAGECGPRQCLTFSIACHIRWTKRQVIADTVNHFEMTRVVTSCRQMKVSAPFRVTLFQDQTKSYHVWQLNLKQLWTKKNSLTLSFGCH